MKCSVCKKEIRNELNMVLLNGDGDFACSKACKDKYIKDKNEFFANIGDDLWYDQNYFPLD